MNEESLRVATRERPALVAAAPAVEEITAALEVGPSTVRASVIDLGAEIEAMDALLEGPRPTEEGIRIDRVRGAARTIDAHYASVVAGCVERLTLFARQRFEKPRARLPRVEARMLAQIDALAVASVAPEALVECWREDADSPWVTWGTAFALGCFEGEASLAALLELVEELGDDAGRAALLAGDAVARAPHPGVEGWMRDALRSARGPARAAAIEGASIRGLLSSEVAHEALRDARPVVALAGARAVSRFAPAEEALVLGLRALLEHSSADVAFEAAYAMTLAGSNEALFQVRERRGPLAKRLGVGALELLVLGGALSDFEVLMQLVGALEASKETLDAVARFGHPAGREVLERHLGDEELGDHAADALETLFGEAALGGRVFDPAVRLRRGEAWSRRGVAVECASGRLSRRAVEGRLGELRVQSGVRAQLDIGGFGPDSEGNLRAAIELYNVR